MLKFIFILFEVIVLFNLLIFVHELGHYLAARWRGLKIDRFAIWFGKPIWKTKWNGVEFCLGWIPAGGYVALPQMAPMESIEGKSSVEPRQPLAPISALDKIIVAFAGPLFSFGLAFVFAILIWQIGRPVSESERTRVIGYVEKDSSAEKAGIRAGDEILKVDGKPVNKFYGMNDSVLWRVIRSEGATIPVEVKRGDQIATFEFTPVIEPTKKWYQRKNLRKVPFFSSTPAIVDAVTKDGPASVAGLKQGDRLVNVNGKPLFHPGELSDVIAETPNEAVALTVDRGGKTIEVKIKPEIPVESPGEKYPMLGIKWQPEKRTSLVYPKPWEQIRQSVENMVSTFSALFSPNSSIKAQHMGGAVKIVSTYYALFESPQGWRLALWFSVVININLALLNLLPIPVLDGGHIVLAMLEGIRRKPVNIRILEYVQTGCAVLLIGFMIYVTFFDVQDLSFKGFRKKAPEQELRFAPKN